MKISINRANKIRNALETRTFQFNTSLGLRTNSTVGKAEEDLLLSKKNLEEEFEKSIQIIQYTSVIRSIINESNNICGITPLIAAIAQVERTLRHLKDQSDNLRRVGQKGSFEDYKALVEHRESVMGGDPTKAPAPTVVLVDIGSGVRALIEKATKTLRLELGELQEKRNALNHSHYIELPTDLVEFLKANSLLA